MRSHDTTLLGFHDPDLGEIYFVTPSWDNASFVLFTQVVGRDRLVTRCAITFRNQIHYQGDPQFVPQAALSFDGRRLALLHHPHLTGEPSFLVTINGHCAFTVPLDAVHYFKWLDGDRLACRGFNRTVDGHTDANSIQYYVNGERKNSGFYFEPIETMCDHPLIDVIEDGKRYLVFDSGARSEALSAAEYPFHIPFPRDKQSPPVPEQVPVRKGRFQVKLQDALSPVFEGLATCCGVQPFVFSSDGALVGYIGIQNPAWVQRLENRLQNYLDRITEPAATAQTSLPNYLARFSLAMLFHEDFGPGTRAFGRLAKTKRFCPVKNLRAWRKTYDYVDQSFFTSCGRLVVVAYDRGKMRVVIDEAEGPRFDAIYNVRVMPNGRVCYLARRRREFMRVLVDR